jgi:ribosomal protein S18 acetylase RimI-like enzyme
MTPPDAAEEYAEDPRAPRFTAAAGLGLSFRRVCEADLPFLAQVYASTRTEELAVVPWSDAQKAAFLDMQFRAQHAHYQQHYPTADRFVILRTTEPVGRLYLGRFDHEHSVIEIALLPAHRGQGLGTALMQDLLDEAAAAGKPLRIHVEKNNPARHLYARLGFRPVADHGVYDLLERSPDPTQVNAAS